jgi:hypothetical protein
LGRWASENIAAVVSAAAIGPHQAHQAGKEVVLQQELLHARADGIAGVTLDKQERTANWVQRLQPRGNEDGDGRCHQRDADHPQRAHEVGSLQAHRAPSRPNSPEHDRQKRGGNRVAQPLPWARRPDDHEDQRVAN